MPNYSYQCSSKACLNAFTLVLTVEKSQAIQFCPLCASIATRDVRDFASVRSMKAPQFHDYPEVARQLKTLANHHVHGPGCGCVLTPGSTKAGLGLTATNEQVCPPQ